MSFPSSTRQVLCGQEERGCGGLGLFVSVWRARNKTSFEDDVLSIQIESSCVCFHWLETKLCTEDGPLTFGFMIGWFHCEMVLLYSFLIALRIRWCFRYCFSFAFELAACGFFGVGFLYSSSGCWLFLYGGCVCFLVLPWVTTSVVLFEYIQSYQKKDKRNFCISKEKRIICLFFFLRHCVLHSGCNDGSFKLKMRK